MIPSDLWSRPTDAVRELSYLEARDLDCDEHGQQCEQQPRKKSLIATDITVKRCVGVPLNSHSYTHMFVCANLLAYHGIIIIGH